MTTSEIQLQIFQHIKSKLPSHISMVNELSSVLKVSTDSAYRRLRGEKPISLDEIYKLCVHFNLSLDNLLHLKSDAFIFKGNPVNPDLFNYAEYLTNIGQVLKHMSGFREKSMVYLIKDIPTMHHFHFREIAAFKHYFWMRNVYQNPEFAKKKFTLNDYPDEYFELGRTALNYYNQIDSEELWSVESINSILHQIEYYCDSNIFSNSDEIYALFDATEKLISHIEYQASEGFKFSVDDIHKPLGRYQMYLNEMLILDGNILVTLDGTKTAFLVHNSLNYLQTNDVRFCDNMYVYIEKLKRRSTLMSKTSEEERTRFCSHQRQRIATRKKKLRIC